MYDYGMEGYIFYTFLVKKIIVLKPKPKSIRQLSIKLN